MPSRRTQRSFALFALALVLLAALPCAMLASEEPCCAMASPCSDASESPCAQLATASCCEAPQAPLDSRVAPQLPTPAPFEAADAVFDTRVCFGASPRLRDPAAPLRDAVPIRSVVLRL